MSCSQRLAVYSFIGICYGESALDRTSLVGYRKHAERDTSMCGAVHRGRECPLGSVEIPGREEWPTDDYYYSLSRGYVSM